MKKIFDFNTIAGQYDYYYQSDFGKKVDALERKLIGDLLKMLPEKNLFEIGCGTGHWTKFFTENGFSVIATDIADKMLEQARKKNIKNAVFKYADVLNLDIKDNTLNNIIAIASLEFTGNLQKASDEIYRVLKPGGYFICAGLNGSAPFWNTQKNDPLYQSAEFFHTRSLQKLLSKFGNPEIRACVVIENDRFTDNQYSEKEKLNKGAFIAAIVQKNK